jgi:hypothetical protein
MADGSDVATTPVQATPAQVIAFTEAICESWDHRDAAAAAGLDEDQIAGVMSTSLVQRAMLLHDPQGDKRAAAQAQRAEEVRAFLWSVMEDTEHDIDQRIKAADKLMKSYGGYIHRVQVDARHTAPPVQRGLTDEVAASIRTKVLGAKPVLTVAARESEGKTG